MSWKTASLEWIDAQIAAHPELDRDALKRHCSEHYPYRERKGWAYKAWLSAMAERFGSLSPQLKARAHGQGNLGLDSERRIEQ